MTLRASSCSRQGGDGNEAVACGLATRVCANPLEAAHQTAREIAGRSPDAVRAIKRLFNRVDEEDMATMLMAESASSRR